MITTDSTTIDKLFETASDKIKEIVFTQPIFKSIKTYYSGEHTIVDYEISFKKTFSDKEEKEIFLKNLKNIKIKIFEDKNNTVRPYLINYTSLDDDLKKFNKIYKDYTLLNFIQKPIQKISTDQIVTQNQQYLFLIKDKLYFKGKLQDLNLSLVCYIDPKDIFSEVNISQTTTSKFLMSYVYPNPIISLNNIPQSIDFRDNNLPLNVSKNFNDLYESLNFNDKTLNFLNKKNDIELQGFYDSEIYYSKDRLGNINFLFNLDEMGLFSTISQNIKNASISNSYQSNITNIAVIKKNLERNERKNNNKLYQIGKTIEMINLPSDLNKNLSGTGKAAIRRLPKSFLGSFREQYTTFEVVDQKVLGKRYYYQYGLRITYKSSFNKADTDDRLKSLYNFKKKLLEYSNYTNLNNYFDQNTQNFKNNFEGIWNSEFNQPFASGISFALATIKHIYDFNIKHPGFTYNKDGIIQPYSNKVDNLIDIYRNTFIKMLDYKCTNYNIINKFISIINRLISFGEKEKEVNKDFIETKEVWFKTIIDGYTIPNIGYSFFPEEKNLAGFLEIDNRDLEQKIQSDIFEYTSENKLPEQASNNKFLYVTPSKIYSLTKNLTNLTNNLNISDKDLIDIWLDILYNNYTGDRTPTTHSGDGSYQGKFQTLFDKLSVSLKNYNKEKDSKDIIYLAIKVFLGMNSNGNPLEIKPTNNNTPWHLVTLYNNLDKYFSYKGVVTTLQSDAKYGEKEVVANNINLADPRKNWRTNVETIPRYLLFYNNIHKIQILTAQPYNDPILGFKTRQTWNDLNLNIYNNLNNQKQYLARLVLDESMTNFNLVSLPVYDQYFYFGKKVSQKEVDAALENQKQSSSNYVKQQERKVIQDINGKQITEDDGSSPYFEEDLSNKSLLNEYIKAYVWGKDNYNSKLFTYEKIIAETNKRFPTDDRKRAEIIAATTVPTIPDNPIDQLMNTNGIEKENYIFSKRFISDINIAYAYQKKQINFTLENSFGIENNAYGAADYSYDPPYRDRPTKPYYFYNFTAAKALIHRFGLKFADETAKIVDAENQRRAEAERERERLLAEAIYRKSVTNQQNNEKNRWAGDKTLDSQRPPDTAWSTSYMVWKQELIQELKAAYILKYNTGVYYPPYGSSLYHITFDKLETVFARLIGRSYPLSDWAMYEFLGIMGKDQYAYLYSSQVKFWNDVRKKWYDDNYSAWQDRLRKEEEQARRDWEWWGVGGDYSGLSYGGNIPNQYFAPTDFSTYTYTSTPNYTGVKWQPDVSALNKKIF